MAILKSSLDVNSKEFTANRSHMEKLVAILRDQQAKAALGGDDKARKKHTDRGKLLPRQRIEALLDRGSPFLELAPFAAHGMYENEAPCAGIITGIGRVHGREVMVAVHNYIDETAHYPKSLQDLVPKYLPAIPTEPEISYDPKNSTLSFVYKQDDWTGLDVYCYTLVGQLDWVCE